MARKAKPIAKAKAVSKASPEPDSTILVSPKYTLANLKAHPDLDTKINIFEDRIKGWMFAGADCLLKAEERPESYHLHDYCVLSILTVYFEMIARYSSATFAPDEDTGPAVCEGIRLVFPILNERQRHNIYHAMRCKLYHVGFTRNAIVGTTHTHAFRFVGSRVWINPVAMFQGIKDHFGNYVETLRDEDAKADRHCFETAFDANPKL